MWLYIIVIIIHKCHTTGHGSGGRSRKKRIQGLVGWCRTSQRMETLLGWPCKTVDRENKLGIAEANTAKNVTNQNENTTATNAHKQPVKPKKLIHDVCMLYFTVRPLMTRCYFWGGASV